MSRTRPEKAWISRGEARRQLGLSSMTFGNLVKAGLVGSLTLPGVSQRKYSASDVAALVAGGMIPAKRREELAEV